MKTGSDDNSKTVSWNAEVLADEPGVRIAWHSTSGEPENAGEVIFEPAPAGRGTVVTLLQEFHTSKLASAWETLVGRNPKQAVIENLRRITHRDAPCASSVEVEGVKAHTETRYDLQIGQRADQFSARAEAGIRGEGFESPSLTRQKRIPLRAGRREHPAFIFFLQARLQCRQQCPLLNQKTMRHKLLSRLKLTLKNVCIFENQVLAYYLT